ncbi:uncharacterized protein EDB93DRAFT_1057123, partial [Suillus bovinus]|uniref:uncharacterized protein n=1 Tax=Suillus bovinus TaxID=48563 RepID=UPI001B8827D5
MGDPLAERAMCLLNAGSGYYPGDRCTKRPDPERFLVYRVSDSEHVIMDCEDRRDPELTIHTLLLMNPQFHLREWYAKHVGRLRGYVADKLRKLRRKVVGPEMGETLGRRVADILRSNGPYEKDVVQYKHPERFECVRLYDGSYEVRDYAKAFRVPIPTHLLLRERFEVARWFKSRLTRAYGKLCDEITHNAPEYDLLRLL